MKICVIGDLHLRTKRPRCRREEDFAEVGLEKLEQILLIANDHKVDIIVQTGDWFHSANPSNELVIKCLKILQEVIHPPILAIHGQHDLEYHTESAARRSALRVLEAAKALTILEADKSYTIPSEPRAFTFWGAPWGQEPIPVQQNGRANVLVAHTMVGDKPLWLGQDLRSPSGYIKKHPGFDLYLFGDYHYPFYTIKEKKLLALNPGCVIRQNASERELAHQPAIVIITFSELEEDFYVDTINLEVSSVEEAFDLSLKDEPIKPDEKMTEFVRSLKEAGKIGVDFKSNLTAYLESHDEPEGVHREIWQALEK